MNQSRLIPYGIALAIVLCLGNPAAAQTLNGRDAVKLEWNLNDWGRSTPPLVWWVWRKTDDNEWKYITGTRYYWDGTQKINVILDAKAGDVFRVVASYSYDGSGKDNQFSTTDVSAPRDLTVSAGTPRTTAFSQRFTIEKSTDLKTWVADERLYLKEAPHPSHRYDIQNQHLNFNVHWNSIYNFPSQPIYPIPADNAARMVYRIKMESGPF